MQGWTTVLRKGIYPAPLPRGACLSVPATRKSICCLRLNQTLNEPAVIQLIRSEEKVVRGDCNESTFVRRQVADIGTLSSFSLAPRLCQPHKTKCEYAP